MELSGEEILLEVSKVFGPPKLCGELEIRNSPMYLSMTTGCTANSLTVNGKEEVDLTPKQRKEAWTKLCLWLAEKDGEELNNFLQYVLETYGEYQSLSDEPCECCGDWVSSYTLTIN